MTLDNNVQSPSKLPNFSLHLIDSEKQRIILALFTISVLFTCQLHISNYKSSQILPGTDLPFKVFVCFRQFREKDIKGNTIFFQLKDLPCSILSCIFQELKEVKVLLIQCFYKVYFSGCHG